MKEARALVSDVNEDIDRRRELRLAVLQSLALILIFSLAIIGLHPGVRLGVFLIFASTFLTAYRAWALERFSPSSAGTYARIFATDHLTLLLNAFKESRDLRPMLGPSAEEDLGRLTGVSNRAREDAASILRDAGYPARKPIPLMSLLGSLISFGVGSVLGAWLPTTSLSATFTSLCDTHSVISALIWPWHLLLQGPVAIVVVATVIIKMSSTLANRAQIRRAHAFFSRNASGELRGVLTGPYAGRRQALLRDIGLLARMAGASKDQADAILETYGAEVKASRPQTPAWLFVRLSTVNELSKNQLLFVFGLYLGLALPNLLHLGGTVCH